jgi:hypothetical protein
MGVCDPIDFIQRDIPFGPNGKELVCVVTAANYGNSSVLGNPGLNFFRDHILGALKQP